MMDAMGMDFASLDRYDRQMRFAPIGRDGQARLCRGFVVILGCGALGSGVAHNLARAGVGRLRIVDRDILDITNLHRQVLYTEEDVRQRLPKAVATAKHLEEINSGVVVEPIVAEVNGANVLQLIEGADVVADGMDNMAARFVINDACVKLGIPYVYGGAVAAGGMTMTVLPGRGPCFRCLVEDLPPPGTVKTCADVGVINPLTSMVSAIESGEVMKILVGRGEPNTCLLRFDVWDLSFHRSRVRRRPDCPACGLRRFDFLAPEVQDDHRA